MPSPHHQLRDYLDARGLAMPNGSSARKVAEEAIELVEECAQDDPDKQRIMHEVADVVLAAAVVAEHYGFTIEQAITTKIDLDTGRDKSA